MRATFERIPLVLRVHRCRLGLLEYVAQVQEVLMAGTALGERYWLPLGDKFVNVHAAKLPQRKRRSRWPRLTVPLTLLYEIVNESLEEAASSERLCRSYSGNNSGISTLVRVK